MSNNEEIDGRTPFIVPALITPPKDTTELTLPASNSTQNVIDSDLSIAPLRFRSDVLPHSPVKTSVDIDYEPLPYSGNSLDRSISPIFWQLIHSPLKATASSDDEKTPHEEDDSTQTFGRLPFPGKNPPERILKSNSPGRPVRGMIKIREKEIHEIAHDYGVTNPTSSIHRSSWPMIHLPPHYWYQQYPYGYHHQPITPREDYQNNSMHGFPDYPKSQHDHFHHHPYYPLGPCNRFGNHAFMSDHPKLEYITEVTANDVICGRGGAVNNHAGNRRFRQFIQDFKHQYMMETKQNKPSVAMRVLKAVKSSTPPGRFLVKYPRGYLECGDDRAREKASQALREGAAKLRKQHEMKAGETPEAPTIPDLECPKIFEPPRKKIKVESLEVKLI